MIDRSAPARLGRTFRLLWAGQSISFFGSQVAFLAFPLVASLTLGATPLQLGLLAALGALPGLLGLVAGGRIERLPRRRLLVGASLARGLLLLAIPAAAVAGALRIELLYLVALLGGALALLADVGAQALLPELVAPDELVAANSRLELSRAGAELAGPAVAGALLQFLAAPLVLVADALGYLVSAALLAGVEAPQAPPPPAPEGFWRELSAGLATVWGSPALRWLLGCAVTVSLFNASLEAALFIYVPRELGVPPGLLGLIFALGSLGALLGAALAERAVARVGALPLLAGAILVGGVGDLLTPLAFGPLPAIVATLFGGALLFGLGVAVYRIVLASLRQRLTPPALQTRVAATALALVQAGVLLGALLGGLLAEMFGPRAALLVGACGELLALLWLVPLARGGLEPGDSQHDAGA